MLRARLLVFPLAAAALSASGCKNQEAPPAAPEEASAAPSADVAGAGASAPEGGETEEQLVYVEGSVERLDAMLEAASQLNARMSAGQPVDPQAQIKAILLQLGFGPGFLNSIDLSARHALAVAFPAKGNGLRELSGAVAVSDARKVIDSTPPAYRPAPLGDGLWELRQGQYEFVLQEGDNHLLVGLDREDLGKAKQLAAAPASGHQLHAKAWNISPSEVDPATIGLGDNPQIAAAVTSILGNMQEFEIMADLAPKSDAKLVLGVAAPFEKLGLAALGEPRGASTALERRLPGDPLAVVTIALGDLSQTKKLLDQVVAQSVGGNALPPAFEEIKAKALEGVTTLLDQIEQDAAFAFYRDRRGKPAVVMAASIKDPAATKQGLRALQDAIVKAAELQAVMYAQQKDAQIEVELKRDGARLGRGKGDRLHIKLPKTFQDEVADLAALFPQGTLDTVSYVGDDVAVWGFGPGATAIAKTIASSKSGPKRNLAEFKGLEVLRTTMGGCQICGTVDFVEYTQLRLEMAAEAESGAEAKQLREALAKVRGIGDLGDAGVGLKVAPARGEFGLAAPESLVFAPATAYKKLRDAWALFNAKR